MRTECVSKQLSFERFRRRQVGGGGDYRDSGRTEHDLAVLMAQRVMGLALDYEDLNDHDRVRAGAALVLASGCADVVGAGRVRNATGAARGQSRARS